MLATTKRAAPRTRLKSTFSFFGMRALNLRKIGIFLLSLRHSQTPFMGGEEPTIAKDFAFALAFEYSCVAVSL